MKWFKKCLTILSFLLFFVPSFVYPNLDYKQAFDQEAIHKKYASLMKTWGCDQNVFDQVDAQEYDAGPLDEESLEKMEVAFRAACLRKFRRACNWEILEPAIHNANYTALSLAVTLVMSKFLDKETLGGGLSVLTAAFNSVHTLKDFIKAGYYLVFQKETFLTDLEQKFATNQCFIPKDWWPAIIQQFMVARQNQFEQAHATNFLKFALDLTVHKPKPKADLQGRSEQEIIQILHEKIDRFFDDYEKENIEQSLRLIKLSVSKFVLRLLGKENVMPRYIYFHGPTGIGKTFFVNNLCEWIEELIPGSVCFENMVIFGAGELEGCSQRPGAMLRILRNQQIANKRGSVIFMDEATWLNEMRSAAKRTFNGDQSTITTTYFGEDVEGSGLSIAVPPMLFFLASNDEIEDPALKSRFDIVTFPNPTKEALAMHAMTQAKESLVLSGLSCIKKSGAPSGDALPAKQIFQDWIEKEQIVNFRQVAALVEDFVLSQQ